MSTKPGLRVLDAAQMVEDDINRLAKNRRLFNAGQLRESAESITSNIQEGFGRDIGPDRNKFLRYARASTEEANARLRTRFAAREIPPNVYWPLHHRMVTIVRMLNNLMTDTN